MREVKGKNYWSLVSFLLVVFLIAMIYFVTNPLVESLKEINKKIFAKNEENARLESQLITLEKIKNNLEDDEETTRLLKLSLVEDDMIAEIIECIRNMAKNSALKITSIKQSSSKEENDTIMEVSFEGSYFGFKIFLESLEKNIRFVVPTKISLNEYKSPESQQSFLKGNVTLNFFKILSKTIAKPVDSLNQKNLLEEEELL